MAESQAFYKLFLNFHHLTPISNEGLTISQVCIAFQKTAGLLSLIW